MPGAALIGARTLAQEREYNYSKIKNALSKNNAIALDEEGQKVLNNSRDLLGKNGLYVKQTESGLYWFDGEGDEKYKAGQNKLMIIFLVILVLLIATLGVFFIFSMFMGTISE